MSLSSQREWISLREVARSLGVHRNTAQRIADAGRLTSRRLMHGAHVRYSKADVERLKAESITPARRATA